MKLGVVIVLFILLVATAGLSGCTVAEQSNDGVFSTQKTTTTWTSNGIQTNTKDCPFWNRNC